MNTNDIVTTVLAPHLHRTGSDSKPIVVMTCGIAGAGKTTLAKAIESQYPNFHRLSTDDIVAKRHGLYGVDYPASDILYAEYQDEADDIYLSTFCTLLAGKKDVILERSFYAKEDRDQYRKLVEEAGATLILVFLKAEGEAGKEMVWDRICKRSQGPKTPGSALDISRKLFDSYWDGFEDPVTEGQITVRIG